MPLRFRSPGVALRAEELLERVRPARGARKTLREGRLAFARWAGIGADWTRAATISDPRAPIPPASAIWLEDTSEADGPALTGSSFELETAPLPWPAGVVPVRGGSRFTFERIASAAERARVRFTCEGDAAQRVLGWLGWA